jgi:hypothetical protein
MISRSARPQGIGRAEIVRESSLPRRSGRRRREGKTQEPPKKELARRDVHKTEEKKPERRGRRRRRREKADPEAGREDALAKLLEGEKDWSSGSWR